MLKSEDFWAVVVGGVIILIAYFAFIGQLPRSFPSQTKQADLLINSEKDKPFKTIAFYKALDQKSSFKASKSQSGKVFSWITAKPSSWTDNPLKSFFLTKSQKVEKFEKANDKYLKALNKEEEQLAIALDAENKASEANWENLTLNSIAEAEITKWRSLYHKTVKSAKKVKKSPTSVLPNLLVLTLILLLVFGVIYYYFKGVSFKGFILGFLCVMGVSILAQFIAAQTSVKAMGIGYAAWAIILGMILSNTFTIGEKLKEGFQSELFIKSGLVLLGAEVIFSKLLTIGLPGVFVAWVVTPIVLISTYWFGQNVLKIKSKALNMTICADMSVCGVSAAVATAAACKAKKEELTLAVGLSMVFTSIMMFALPLFIKSIGMSEVLGGAWIGGTIDATGAVVAAGDFLGNKALNVAATIKMIQNVLIGIIALGVAIYWSSKVEKSNNVKIGAGEIWLRFPKFVLGFLGASILISITYSLLGPDKAYTLVDNGIIKGGTKHFRGWFFCMAFASIGLSTNFKELKRNFTGGKPLMLYLVGQSLNLILTLLMAYLMFEVVFKEVADKI